MKSEENCRGFIHVTSPKYTEPDQQARIISESSAIGDYEDSFENPGSSYLWVGRDHHINREEVAELIKRMQYWLDTKRLELDEPTKIPD